MTTDSLGADEFTFAGDRMEMTYLTQTPIPNGGPELRYQGPEGNLVFSGGQIARVDSALGTLLTVVLRPQTDLGAIKITVAVPNAFGVTRQNPVNFGTIAIKTTSRGSISTPGVELTYDVLPLVAQAKQVLLPLTSNATVLSAGAAASGGAR